MTRRGVVFVQAAHAPAAEILALPPSIGAEMPLVPGLTTPGRFVLALCLAAAPAALGAQAAESRANPLDHAAWLAGCWEARTANRVIVEMWMPPLGGMMLGGSRTVVGGSTREFEHLRLRARGDTLVYTAAPSGQTETDFRSTLVSADSLVFENRAHDFPQRISYRRIGADSLTARVEAPGPDNTMRGFSIPMRRVECTARAAAPGAANGGPSPIVG